MCPLPRRKRSPISPLIVTPARTQGGRKGNERREKGEVLLIHATNHLPSPQGGKSQKRGGKKIIRLFPKGKGGEKFSQVERLQMRPREKKRKRREENRVMLGGPKKRGEDVCFAKAQLSGEIKRRGRSETPLETFSRGKRGKGKKKRSGRSKKRTNWFSRAGPSERKKGGDEGRKTPP